MARDLIKHVIPKSVRGAISNYRNQIRRSRLAKVYKGVGVKCPICGAEYRSFAPFGNSQRPNALCPQCGSLERHRLLWLYLQSKPFFFQKRRIKLLHFAPEKAFYNLFSNESSVDYHPVDLFPESYNYQGSVTVKKVNITSIPFSDGYFDAILCNHVLEHIPDDKLAIQELRRVLSFQNGWGIFQVPLDYSLENTYEDANITQPEARKKAFGQIDHVRLYGRDYYSRLADAGFKVKEDDFIATIPAGDIFKYGLMRGEKICFCTPA